MSIQQQITIINESLAWIKAHKPDQYEQRFISLVNQRSTLRKIEEAEKEYPAIAAYGESQKGKSYLVTNLLKSGRGSFKVKANNGTEYDFIAKLNPITNNIEATGVVTRFTTFKDKNRYSEEHPILVKLFSIVDLVAVLCDGYFNDVTDYTTYSDAEINDFTQQIRDQYIHREDVATPISEDDIIDLKNYLTSHINNAQALSKSSFFDTLALVIKKIPQEDWLEVFSFLWHRQSEFNQLFTRLSDSLKKLSYSPEVYLPIEAAFNDHKTIMHVQRLRELGMDRNNIQGDDDDFTNIYIKEDGNFREISHFDKSSLSALCAEAVYKIEQEYLDAPMSYNLEMVSQENQELLPSQDFTKDLLKNCDLIDFPGARSRERIASTQLADKNLLGSTFIVDVLLRGKVSFLFNKYCSSKFINILLFCHDYVQLAAPEMHNTLDSWIDEYVGRDADERRKKVQATGNISPFFIIGTKFNVDMAHKNMGAANEPAQLSERWTARFKTVLHDGVLKASAESWFNNWTAANETFKNIYVLRDYKFSSKGGDGNSLYSGFNDQNPHEKKLLLAPDFYAALRNSFIENEFVRKIFANPALSWDVAATLNNDGSTYIIQNLTIVANAMGTAREEQFRNQVEGAKKAIHTIIDGYYVPDDDEAVRKANIGKAYAVYRELDFSCNEDNYFFGHLIQSLQLSEREVYKIIHGLIQGNELNGAVNNFHQYQLIVQACGEEFIQAATSQEKWDAIIRAYHFEDQEEAAQYLRDRNVDIESLMNGNFMRRMNSDIIAHSVFDMWTKKLESPNLFNDINNDVSFNRIIMGDLIEDIIHTAQALKIEEHMADRIAEFVNVVDIHTANESLLADMLATIINSYIIDFGYSLRDDAEIVSARRLAQEDEHMPIFNFIDQEIQPLHDEAELTNMFVELTNNPSVITPAFTMNYRRWEEFMFVSFLLKTPLLDYDRNANEEISKIINNLNEA